AGAYLATAQGAMHLLRVGADAPMVSLASAVGLAAFLLASAGACAGVWIGAFVYALLSGGEVVPALGSALLTTAQIALAWWLLARGARMDPRLECLRDVLMLILVGATVIPLANVLPAALACASPDSDPALRIALPLVSALGEA